ncbi:MAG: photosynthesis system II assembly factor Ycf48 [Synechococcales cyanobacterium T60_A2020_003]|nr:photosynthesis system II assembly factor Ycf48 [Synechococcales cyanobacterium T60_A2020_003]
MKSILNSLKAFVVVAVVVLFCTGCANAYLPPVASSPWEVISLPNEVTPLDIAFTSDANHGWLVGKQSSLMETTDGGKTWEPRTLDLGTQIYNFSSISFFGNEGWVVGEPTIMLHTTDGGKTWSQVPLSEQLPGTTRTVVALGKDAAELTTDVGAIYQTKDGGRNWQAMVQEAVGVLRNISRSPDGHYVSVSARGNFYSTWEPGQDAWQPHNRNSSRRLQNMGFTSDGRLWLLARGGIVQFGNSVMDLEDWSDAQSPEFSTSWGLLDLAYRTPEDVWVAGGSGNLLYSPDGGKTWQKDRTVESVPSNFYKVTFLTPDQGFVLGQDGVMLRYNPNSSAA